MKKLTKMNSEREIDGKFEREIKTHGKQWKCLNVFNNVGEKEVK